MIYRKLDARAMERIEGVLTEAQVSYQVAAVDETGEPVARSNSRVRGRLAVSVDLEIPDEEWSKLTPEATETLTRLGVHPPYEVPEGLFLDGEPPENSGELLKSGKDQKTPLVWRVLSIVVLALGALAYLARRFH